MNATYYNAGYVGQNKTDAYANLYAAAVSCKSCHHICAVSWKAEGINGIPDRAAKKLKVCPICGKNNTINKETTVIAEQSSAKMAVQQLEQRITLKDEENIRKKINSLISKVSTADDLPDHMPQAVTLLGSVDLLKQYFSHVLNAEAAVYFLSERLLSIQKAQLHCTRESKHEKASQISSAAKSENAAKRAQKKLEKERATALEEINRKISQLREEYQAHDFAADVDCADCSEPEPLVLLPTDRPIRPSEPTYKTPGLFNKKKVEAENAALLEAYINAQKDYESGCAQAEANLLENQRRKEAHSLLLSEFEERIKAEEERRSKQIEKLKKQALNRVEAKIRRLEQKFNEKYSDAETIEEENPMTEEMDDRYASIDVFLKAELSVAEAQLKEAVKIRGSIYSVNVIHPKYRNQIAVSTFYEYLDTCRCTSLAGPSGAYNLFESEIRSNTIISQLTTVISSLEEIKYTQKLMYMQMQQLNSNLQVMNRSMDQAVDQLSRMNRGLDNVNAGIQQMHDQLRKISRNTSQIAITNKAIEKNTKTTAENTTTIMAHTKEIAENTAVSAHYSAVTAHYSKLNAELTNALGFMMALG